MVETDHSLLIYLQTQLSLSMRQARWLEFFQQFDFEVCYKKKGTMNKVADALSRLQVAHIRTVLNVQSEWRDKFVMGYEADSKAREARKAMAQGGSTWSERDGLLGKGAKLYVLDLSHVRVTLIKEAQVRVTLIKEVSCFVSLPPVCLIFWEKQLLTSSVLCPLSLCSCIKNISHLLL